MSWQNQQLINKSLSVILCLGKIKNYLIKA